MPANRKLNVASGAPTGNALTITDAPTLKVVRRVTVPTLSQKKEAESIVYFTITGPMVQSKKAIKQAGSAIGNKAWLIPIIDLMDGNEKNYVLPAILKSQLEDDYMDGRQTTEDDKGNTTVTVEGTPTYIGKSFAVQKLPPSTGKRYANLNVAEIDGADFASQRQAQLAAAEAA